MATVKKRGKSFLIRVYAGYDVDGKQIEQTRTWTPPAEMSNKRAEKEAYHQAALFEEQIREGSVSNGKIKFSEFAVRWFSYAESRLRPRTLARYQELWSRINPVLGHIPLSKIRPTHLLSLYKELESEIPKNSTYKCICDLKAEIYERGMTKADFSKNYGISLTTLSTAFHRMPISIKCATRICTGLNLPLESIFQPINPSKSLSSTTIKHYHHLISSILGDAVHWQYIPYNPCSRIDAPKAAAPDIEYLDDNDAVHLMELLLGEPYIYRCAISLLLLTGLRRGELLGLEWRDVNYQTGSLSILRTSQYLPKKGVFTDEPKNKSSKRVVVIPSQVIHLLQELQRYQQELLGSAWHQNIRIITDDNAIPLHPDRLSRWFSKFIKRTDLPPIHLHSLRHTYATLCIAHGVPLTAVAAQLGHANVGTTAAIYAHAIKSAQIAAADKIGKLFEHIL